ncbi:MAG: hypothetical protein Q9174_001724 [Haloplaca sp. 1 TL-2023]
MSQIALIRCSRNVQRILHRHHHLSGQPLQEYATTRALIPPLGSSYWHCHHRVEPSHRILSLITQRSFHLTHRQATATKSKAEEEDSENFWKVPAENKAFWSAYVSTRPAYSAPFYDLIYNYHSSHSSEWNLAHDVGCGAGQVTAELAGRFQHVIASEINDTHLVIAEERLRRDISEEQVSFRHSMGEQLAEYYPSDSANLIAVAEAMVLMDEQSALRNFARLLRPGGTLAFWFYGRPTFADAALFKEAQPLIDALMARNWTKVIQGSGPKRLAGFRRAAEGMSSWLDYVHLDPDIWTDVHRIKWNTHSTLPFFQDEAGEFPVKPKNRVGARDKVEVIDDPTWWQNQWDLEQLRDYFRVLFPGFKDAVGEGNKEMESLYDDLGKVMGKGKTAFTWPVALVMTTRK